MNQANIWRGPLANYWAGFWGRSYPISFSSGHFSRLYKSAYPNTLNKQSSLNRAASNLSIRYDLFQNLDIWSLSLSKLESWGWGRAIFLLHFSTRAWLNWTDASRLFEVFVLSLYYAPFNLSIWKSASKWSQISRRAIDRGDVFELGTFFFLNDLFSISIVCSLWLLVHH
jgi:hypothetical protein